MSKKLKTILLVSIFFSSSILLAGPSKENDIKNKKINFFKMFDNEKIKKSKIDQTKSKKLANENLKNSKLKRKIIDANDESNRSLDNNFKLDKHLKVQNFNSDLDFLESEMMLKLFQSDFGYTVSKHLLKFIPNLEEIYSDFMFGLDISDNELFLSKDDISLDNLNIKEMSFNEVKNLLDFFAAFCKKDLHSAEEIASKLNEYKNFANQALCASYAQLNDVQNARRIFESIDFEESNDEDDDSFDDANEDRLDSIDDLMCAYLRLKDFKAAEEIANTVEDDYDRDDLLKKIVKYYSWTDDTKNALRVINTMDNYYSKSDSIIYVLDSYARQDKEDEIQKLVASNKYEDLKIKSDFILDIYQSNFDDALKIISDHYCGAFKEDFIKNIIEVLLSNNQIDLAKKIFDLSVNNDYYVDFCAFEVDDMNLDFVYAYIKNNEIEKAKSVRSEIESSLNKWIASKLIAIHLAEAQTF